MDPFEDLIHDFGVVIDLPLKADSRQSCKLDFDEDFTVQIDLDTSGDKILIGSQLGELSAGPYREKIFRKALHVNGNVTSVRGVLAYSTKNSSLVLFEYLPLSSLNGETLYKYMQTFISHAQTWHEALKRGEVPTIEGENLSQKSSGFFGLKP